MLVVPNRMASLTPLMIVDELLWVAVMLRLVVVAMGCEAQRLLLVVMPIGHVRPMLLQLSTVESVVPRRGRVSVVLLVLEGVRRRWRRIQSVVVCGRLIWTAPHVQRQRRGTRTVVAVRHGTVRTGRRLLVMRVVVGQGGSSGRGERHVGNVMGLLLGLWGLGRSRREPASIV